MNLKLAINALLIGAMCTVTSCLNDDDTDYSTYEQAAITSMTFQTLTRLDSTTFSAKTYPISIDQINRTITCPDSLPVNTDLRKIMVSVGTSNAAIPYMQKEDGNWTTMTTADTLDCTSTRNVKCVSYNGQSSIDYTMTFCAHKEYADSFSWGNAVTANEIAQLTDIKALCVGNRMVVMGKNGDKALIYSAETSSPDTWTDVTYTSGLSANAQMTTDGTALYVLDNGNVCTMAPDLSWTATALSSSVKALAAAYHGTLYAIGEDKTLMYSTDNGASWITERRTEDASELPDACLNSYSYALENNNGLERLTIVGYKSDGTSVIWSKLFDLSGDGADEAWMYQGYAPFSSKRLPVLNNVSVTYYKEQALATGSGARDIYVTHDNGLTWDTENRFKYPSDYDSSTDKAVVVADNNNLLWLISAGSGKVWRGRVNKYTWEEQPQYYK